MPTITDFYDFTHQFFRDLLGYWLPGTVLIPGFLICFEGRDGRTLAAFFRELQGANAYTFLALLLVTVTGGYMMAPIGRYIRMAIEWLVKAARKQLKSKAAADHLKDFREEIAQRFIAWAETVGLPPGRLAKIEEESSGAVSRHVVYSLAQTEVPELYKTLVPRHYSQQLFHQNLLGLCVTGMAIALIRSHWDVSAWVFGLAIVNAVGTRYYYKKREIAIQNLIILWGVRGGVEALLTKKQAASAAGN